MEPCKIVKRQCIKCGHVQTVASYAVDLKENGEHSYYFGSAYDFCDKCDGAMITLESQIVDGSPSSIFPSVDKLKTPVSTEVALDLVLESPATIYGYWQIAGPMGLRFAALKKPTQFHVFMMKLLLGIEWISETKGM